MDLLEWYLGGAHEDVWNELARAGPAALERPLATEAEAVARETMRRARANVERLIPRLQAAEWRFRYPRKGPPTSYCVHAPPRRDVDARIRDLEKICGPLPLSLRAWWRFVGTVCFMREPAYETPLPDPLVIDPIEAVLQDAREWARDEARRGREPRFRAAIAPDELHKDGAGVGAAYEVELPHAAADAELLNEWHETTFVGYLRAAFQWGGLPGYSRSPTRRSFAADLARGLLPI